MRVFMLGWEFPPFISGGLGTACYGLTKAMSGLGTEILFVLPRPVTSPFSTHVKLLSPRAGSVRALEEFDDQHEDEFGERPAVAPWRQRAREDRAWHHQRQSACREQQGTTRAGDPDTPRAQHVDPAEAGDAGKVARKLPHRQREEGARQAEPESPHRNLHEARSDAETGRL